MEILASFIGFTALIIVWAFAPSTTEETSVARAAAPAPEPAS